MASDTLFPPETVGTLRRVNLLIPVFSSSQPTTTSTHRLCLYRNLAQFVGHSQLEYRPAFFSELFTQSSIYPAPVLDAAEVESLVEQHARPYRHDVHNEGGLRQLITDYLLAVANDLLTEAMIVAESAGDDETLSIFNHRIWCPQRNTPWRNAVILRQSCLDDMLPEKALPHVAAGIVKSSHTIDDHSFDSIVTMFASALSPSMQCETTGLPCASTGIVCSRYILTVLLDPTGGDSLRGRRGSLSRSKRQSEH